MRIRALTAKRVKRPFLSTAHHVSSNARHTLRAVDGSAEVVLPNSLYGSDAETTGTRSRPKRLIRYLQHYLPFDNFSSSLYSVPMLLLFRLFYPAAPYAIKSGLSQNSTRKRGLAKDRLVTKVSASDFLSTHAKLDVCTFSEAVNSCPELANAYRISTVTWVKALASPLSHEYIQVLIEHGKTGERFRLVTDRSDVGDKLIVGWNWSSQEYASHHHVLPLPLLSLSFENSSGPSLSQLSTILTETSRVQEYNLLREMCWWYAERVFTQVAQLSPNVTVKQWPHASLRYSFVVQNEWIKRRTLVREAEDFRATTRTQMLY